MGQFGTRATGSSIAENNRLNQIVPRTRGTIGDEKQLFAQRTAELNPISNIPKPPAGMSMTRPAAPKPFTANDLFQDAAPVYQPLMDLYGTQQQAARERYGVNQADIKNIFGNLTTIRGEDKAKIAQQYQTSIEQQQQALAARTAEARQGVAAGQQGAAMAAGEMGTAGQPAPTTSLTAQAAEQGIADANAYQTTWSALQNVMSQQAQNDVQSAVQGYDYQQASALEQLRANLEDRLAGIEENMAGTESQVAQTNFGSRQNVLNAKYGEVQDAKAQASRLAAAQASAAADAAKEAAKPKTYPRTASGWESEVTDTYGPGVSQGIRSFVTNQIRAVEATVDASTGRPKKVTQSDIIRRLNSSSQFSNDPAVSKAIEYVQKYSGLPAR
jgi:hypothetical protein